MLGTSGPLRTYIGFSVLRGLCLSAALSAVACGSRAAAAPSPQNFPVYAGNAVQLFDDRIEPTAVGLADVADNPRTDAVLRARTQRAEVVARARISTVSVDSAGGRPVYRLRFTFVEPLVVSRGFSGNQIEIAVRDDSPAFGIVKWLDTRLIGHSFVAFFHRFAGNYEPEVRFHLSPDDPQVLAAVRDASALNELSKP
ncbi:MAG TPA: cobalamin ABC transporter substrate-binding protein [Polyangiaceae bacterium]|nr:cobalamin ABC transporter substrate-binding protein [Polyangiaceae bacterium]